jgi:hypothetical protein
MTLASSPASSQVVPGILGFLVVAGMGILLYFLLRSMNKQLRKVVPGPQWKEEARQNNQAQAQEEQQDYSTNGTVG